MLNLHKRTRCLHVWNSMVIGHGDVRLVLCVAQDQFSRGRLCPNFVVTNSTVRGHRPYKEKLGKKPNICHSVIQSNRTAPLEPARKTAKSEIRALGLGDNIHRGLPRVPSAGGAPPVI